MNFIDSNRVIFLRYTPLFAGRCSRMLFFRFWASGICIVIVVGLIVGLFYTPVFEWVLLVFYDSPDLTGVIGLVLGLVVAGWFYYWFFLYSTVFCTISIKRLHDLNLSSWYFFLLGIPIVGLVFGLYLLFGKGSRGDNRFAPDPLAEQNPEAEISD